MTAELKDDDRRLVQAVHEVTSSLAKACVELRPLLQRNYGLSDQQATLAMMGAVILNAHYAARVAAGETVFEDCAEEQIITLIRQAAQDVEE